ncbi:MAG TPA: hypothetical protein VFZ00_05545 [Solirubrobacter sp.]|nr:hypothetical protein [Solirubrobacter sp.]
MRRFILPIATAAAIAATAFAIPSAGAGDVAHHGHSKPDRDTRELARQIARARLALAPYATNLGAAQAAGYKLTITQHMPGMGWHFMNPDVTDFDVTRPPILVYIRKNGQDQLVAAEWVWPTKPAKRPLPGAKYGSFAAACHYVDGTFTPQPRESKCAKTSPDSGAAFSLWHPDLVTMHLWLWYPNPDGVFNPTNPLIAPFDR